MRGMVKPIGSTCRTKYGSTPHVPPPGRMQYYSLANTREDAAKPTVKRDGIKREVVITGAVGKTARKREEAARKAASCVMTQSEKCELRRQVKALKAAKTAKTA